MTFSLEVLSPEKVGEGTFKEFFIEGRDVGDFEAEKENVSIIVGRAKDNLARLHVLSDEDSATIYGFAALHLSSFRGAPAAFSTF